MTRPMMMCGHASNAEDGEGNPVCVICIGINPGADMVSKEGIDLSGRTARCMQCGSVTESDVDLAFFKYLPDREYDSYYNGCRGWD